MCLPPGFVCLRVRDPARHVQRAILWRAATEWLTSCRRRRVRLVAHRRGGRKREENGRAATRLALRPDPATVGVDDSPADGESEPGAPAFRLLGLPEPIEDVIDFVFRHSTARVRDPETNL